MIHEIMSSAEKFTTHTIRQRKADGSVKERDIHVPSDEVVQQHQKMLHLLYGIDVPMPHATGALPGVSLLDNVRPHQNSNHFYMMDLEDAYGSVDKDFLLDLAESPLIPRRHQDEVQDFIQNWATDKSIPGLPLGAPASPYLFNLYCVPLDRMIKDLGYPDIAYTRYLDDLTFSSLYKIGKKRRRNIRSVIDEYPGIRINHDKTRVHTLGSGAVTITGVSLYPDNRRLGPSPSLLERAKENLDDTQIRIDKGQLMFDDDIGRLYGYHGALDQISTQETPGIASLQAQYKFVLKQAKAQRA